MSEILIVDDERVVRDAFRAFFEEEGFAVRTASDGVRGVALFAERRPDLVLLDVMMPKMDGYRTATAMRELDRETPIVFLSALGSDEDQIRGLEVGADDYVVKTASNAVLLARVRKALERARRFASVEAPTEMTKIQADIYRLLASERGRFFSYREIFAAICGEGYYHDEGTVRTHVSRLRKSLPAGLAIAAKRGRGYALVEAPLKARRVFDILNPTG